MNSFISAVTGGCRVPFSAWKGPLPIKTNFWSGRPMRAAPSWRFPWPCYSPRL
jgi:hypothetical protein